MVKQYDYPGCLHYILKKKKEEAKNTSIIIIVEIFVPSFWCIQLIKNFHREQYRNVPTSSPAGQNIVTDGPSHPQKQTHQEELLLTWFISDIYICMDVGARGSKVCMSHAGRKDRMHKINPSTQIWLSSLTHSLETGG